MLASHPGMSEAADRYREKGSGAELARHLLDRFELGDVKVRVGFNVTEPPSDPGFTTELQFSDLQSVQSGELTPASSSPSL